MTTRQCGALVTFRALNYDVLDWHETPASLLRVILKRRLGPGRMTLLVDPAGRWRQPDEMMQHTQQRRKGT